MTDKPDVETVLLLMKKYHITRMRLNNEEFEMHPSGWQSGSESASDPTPKPTHDDVLFWSSPDAPEVETK